MTDIGKDRGVFQIKVNGATGVGDIIFNHRFIDPVNLKLYAIEVRTPVLEPDKDFYYRGVATSRLFQNVYNEVGYPNRLETTLNSHFNFVRTYNLQLGKVWLNTTERIQLYDAIDEYTHTDIVADITELVFTFEWEKV